MKLNIEMGIAYDTMFGLYDRVNDWTPLKWVAQHPAEDPWDRLGIKPLIEDYVRFGIKEFMTLDAFLQAPYPYAQTVLKIAQDELRKRSAVLDDDEDKLRREEERLRNGK
ncbi:TPA: hypothetical protein OE718_002161 [Escherichia coli]|nr:hypothetical protein [Escherichia coli]EGO7119436.1 hypothetical protein [Salmonella enterica]EIC2604812.1 hypothetical protein [Salmonella enterica subsp. enterica serovar Newport]EIF3301187.1 hypothetical protein [Escherichia coli O157]EII1050052.1 hypothetical protein [Escherichia coli O157]